MSKYTINWENDEVVSVEVNGVQYNSPDEIPDLEDRAKILLMMPKYADQHFDADFDVQFEQEIAKFERQSARFPIVFVTIFLVIAVVMLTIATFSAIRTERALAQEKSAPGQVVELVLRESYDGQTFYYPMVEFTLPDGTLKTVQLAEGSWPPAYDPGDEVIILYNQAQPRDARIQSNSGTVLKWLLTIITGFLGITFLVVALLAAWFLKPFRFKQ